MERFPKLAVPFESQLNNNSGQGFRECFSSSCAMLARFWGLVDSDDDYNRVRARYGDTTEAQAQVSALRGVGLRAHFWSSGRRTDLEREIRGGRPVAVGWLHRGHVSQPTGGHWSVVVGLADADSFWMHDPYGEPLLESGGFIRGSTGRYVRASWRNFLPRWEVEGPASGWYVTAAPFPTVRAG